MAGPLPELHAQILAQKLADGQLALFVGAGLSRQAVAKDGSGRKLPLWKPLAEQVAAACHEDLSTYGGNVLDLFDAIVFGQSRFELEEAVRRAIDDKRFAPSEAHHALARLPWAGVYTTNYDGLLGRVLNETPIVEEDHYDRLQRPDGERPRLFHVHGTLEKPHTLTRDDYRQWPEKHPRAYRDLEAVVLNKTVLFVGYSLSDPHLADGLLPAVRKMTAGREKRLYAWMWQVPPNQVQLLDRRDKIEAIPIARDEDWADAFRQLGVCLAAVTVKGVLVVGLDPYAYDRQQYVAAMEARYGFANLQGLYVGGAGYARTDVSLEEVFVEPDLEVTPTVALAGDGGEATEEMSLRAAMRRRGNDGEGQAREQTRREPAMRVLAREPKLLIVGAPGEGKSTLLRHALLQAAARWREKPETEPFPVLVKLADWEAEEGPAEGRLTAYVESRLPKMGEISSQAVAAWLKGPVLWLLDGIDEIRDPGERIRLAEEVHATSALRPHDRWVIATRPAGEPRGGLGAGWTRAVLPNLSDPQIEQVLTRWGAVLKTKEGLELDARRVAADLERDPGLRQVRGNALLLTLAILFFKTRKRLPHDRWEFYVVADTALRDTWVAHRIREAQRWLPGDYLPELLDRLALDGMMKGHVLFHRATLLDTTESVLAARGYTGGERDKEAIRFVAAAEDLIGVLVGQGPDRFGFLHLTFQEFYAARAIKKKSQDERTALIGFFWDHPDWREVWPLYALAVQNEPAKYEHLFATILGAGRDLDDRLFRPHFACLRLAGVGSAPLPPAMVSVTGWTLNELKGRDWPFFRIFTVLGAWERRHADDLRAALLARLADDDGSVREAAARALAAAGEAEVRAALLARLADDDRNVRQSAAGALAAAVGEAEVRAALLARLADDDRNVRQSAAEALAAAVGEAEVRAALLARLADHKWDVRTEAAWALRGAVGEAEVRAALLERLADEERYVRGWAALTLAAAVGEAEVRAAILARLGDDEGMVRRSAARLLAAAVGEAEVRAALLARLADDDRNVRQSAALALAAAVGEAEVRAALLERLADYSPDVRRAAVQALAAAVGEAEVRAALLTRLAYDDGDVRQAVAQALAAAVGEAEVRAGLLARLADNNRDVRRAAAQALAGWIVAEKFGLPPADVVPVYP